MRALLFLMQPLRLKNNLCNHKVINVIDTIVLLLSKDKFQITEPSKFKPTAEWANNAAHLKSSTISKQNPTTNELNSGIYKPRLTISNHITPNGRQTILKIELSLPKLFFGNNFDEFKTKDFSELCQKLADVLQTMGVSTKIHELSKAPVSIIHFSKNIALTDGTTAYYYINKLKSCNVKQSFDTSQIEYRNDGHCFRWYTKSHEVIFYDKIKEFENTRTNNKDLLGKQREIQLNIFNARKDNKKFEILRMEVRFKARKKMKSLFESLGIKTNLTFKSLFKSTISKRILLHYLDEIETARPKLLDYKVSSDRALLAELRVNNPELTRKQILEIFGFKKALEVYTITELRNIFADNTRTWSRFITVINKLNLSAAQNPFVRIRHHLTIFKRFAMISGRV